MYCFWCLWWGDINKIEYTCKRPKSKVSSQNVIVQEENEAPHSKERFSPNNNKSQLISLLSEYLTSDDQMVHICRGDAATKSVSTALELSDGSKWDCCSWWCRWCNNAVISSAMSSSKSDFRYLFPLRMRETKCRSIKEALKEVNRKEHLQNNFSYICKIKLSRKKASSIRKIKSLRENLLCSLVFTIRRWHSFSDQTMKIEQYKCFTLDNLQKELVPVNFCVSTNSQK